MNSRRRKYGIKNTIDTTTVRNHDTSCKNNKNGSHSIHSLLPTTTTTTTMTASNGNRISGSSSVASAVTPPSSLSSSLSISSGFAEGGKAVDGDGERKPRRLPFSQINWENYLRSGNNAATFWMFVTFSFLFICMKDFPQHVREKRVTKINEMKIQTSVDWEYRVTFKSTGAADTEGSLFLKNLNIVPREMFEEPDFGHLNFKSRESFRSPIPITEDDYNLYERSRNEFLGKVDEYVSSSYYPNEDLEDSNPKCRVMSWRGKVHPRCNEVHELTMERITNSYGGQDYQVSYLNSGAYRDAFRFRRPGIDHLVIKRVRYDWETKDFYKVRKEASILEQLSPSPKVIDIYGSCGTTVFMEAMAGDLHTKIITGSGFASQAELDKRDDVYPLNNFTASEKLQISLDMAEALAYMHGFEGGAIIHADNHIEQFLFAEDGRVKLNDFNNAREPTYDSTANEYCTTKSKYGGVYRPPEEYVGRSQSEASDVYPLGNNIYTMLTGLWPFYDDEYRGVSHSRIRKEIVNKNKRPYVDDRYRTRSFIEGKLVEIMERCWDGSRYTRPTIFEVVELLRETKSNAIKNGELKRLPSDLIKIP